MTKAEKRAAAKAEKARAAAAKRRRQALLGVLAGVAVVAVVVAAFLVFGRDSGSGPTAQPTSSASAQETATPAPAATGAQLPPGADPALGSKPTVAAGKGPLTKLTATPLIQGTGAAVTAGQTISVNYVGVTYADGKEFDASWNRGQPFSFPLGQGQVIKGWDQGLVGAKVGSRIQLDIPADLAYGEQPSNGAPAGPLRFVVDVLGAQ